MPIPPGPGHRIPDPGTYNHQYMSILPMGRVRGRLVVCLLAALVASCNLGAISCGVGHSSDQASSEAAPATPAAPKTDDERPKIVALGDSLTAGPGGVVGPG